MKNNFELIDSLREKLRAGSTLQYNPARNS